MSRSGRKYRNKAIWAKAMRGILTRYAKSYGRVIIEKESPLVIVKFYNRFPGRKTHVSIASRGLTSYRGIPLIAKDEVLGVLGIYTERRASHFPMGRFELLMLLAGQAGHRHL